MDFVNQFLPGNTPDVEFLFHLQRLLGTLHARNLIQSRIKIVLLGISVSGDPG